MGINDTKSKKHVVKVNRTSSNSTNKENIAPGFTKIKKQYSNDVSKQSRGNEKKDTQKRTKSRYPLIIGKLLENLKKKQFELKQISSDIKNEYHYAIDEETKCVYFKHKLPTFKDKYSKSRHAKKIKITSKSQRAIYIANLTNDLVANFKKQFGQHIVVESYVHSDNTVSFSIVAYVDKKKKEKFQLTRDNVEKSLVSHIISAKKINKNDDSLSSLIQEAKTGKILGKGLQGTAILTEDQKVVKVTNVSVSNLNEVLREVKALEKFGQLIDCAYSDGKMYVKMDYVPGLTLEKYLLEMINKEFAPNNMHKDRKITEKTALDLKALNILDRNLQILSILEKYESKGVQHGDAHTENFMHDPKSNTVTALDNGRTRIKGHKRTNSPIDSGTFSNTAIKNDENIMHDLYTLLLSQLFTTEWICGLEDGCANLSTIETDMLHLAITEVLMSQDFLNKICANVCTLKYIFDIYERKYRLHENEETKSTVDTLNKQFGEIENMNNKIEQEKDKEKLRELKKQNKKDIKALCQKISETLLLLHNQVEPRDENVSGFAPTVGGIAQFTAKLKELKHKYEKSVRCSK